ncbi:hypothetical protein CKO25_17920 [Thiocapsa imhoffii]|uniref:Uncharacterized protein n=1 Tax=Thiocapsa imhoffii TaxID=382777 RepID=A0A9X1BAV6_9GAMM|nr:hypothetical protein [Thiocapsa imhoffii]MBK1646488.1 hypothetical protein [Thiocapsa imhoffii]
METPLVYQDMARWQMLRLLRRICLLHKAELLERLCGRQPDISEMLTTWFSNLTRHLESIIRSSGHRDGREAMAMALFRDAEGCAGAMSPSMGDICKAWHHGLENRIDSLLWNKLSQFFKRKMDELDGFAGGHGTHVLQARRRLEKMVRALRERRAAASGSTKAYRSLAELAADVAVEVRKGGLEKQLPATPSKILEYLYESEAAQAVIEDPWDDTLVLTEITSPETWIQLEQCIERLPPDWRIAVNVSLGLDEEPHFMNEAAFVQHYGVGREAMRKRASKARQQLLDCLLG